MRIVYARRALDDLTNIAAYLGPLDPTAARRVGTAIRRKIRRLARHPWSGRLQTDGSRKVVVLPYGYLVFYDASAGRIEILTIQHGARQDRPEDA